MVESPALLHILCKSSGICKMNLYLSWIVLFLAFRVVLSFQYQSSWLRSKALWREKGVFKSHSDVTHNLLDCSDLEQQLFGVLAKYSVPVNRPFPKSGVMAVSKRGQVAIDALVNPYDFTVCGVPVDCRSDAYEQFKKSLLRPSDGNTRLYLLCNAGFQGSGKSTLQSFNLFWFVNHTKHIGIEVTYNDDQGDLWMGGKVDSIRSFRESIAVRILHRVLCELCGYTGATEIVESADVISIVVALVDPISFALRIARRLLNAPSSTKIMLAIDELSRAGKSPAFTPTDMLCQLTKRYLDVDESLFLSVSVYGALDIKQFCTNSSRPLLFQALPPVWHNLHGIDRDTVHLLPAALQPFVDERKRINLPYDDTAKQTYSRVSHLIQLTAGHPRRVEKLMTSLSGFDSMFSASQLSSLEKRGARKQGQEFAAALRLWLDQNEKMVKVTVEESCSFPTSITDLVIAVCGEFRSKKDMVRKKIRVLEKLAVDCARPFRISSPSASADAHAATLTGTLMGYTHILTTSERSTLCFVPMQVLRILKDDRVKWGPCGSALVQLKDSVKSYLSVKTEPGKGLEAVIAASMLLYVRAHDSFPLSTFCAPGHCGQTVEEFDELVGGGDIEYIDWVDSFPPCNNSRFVLNSTHLSDLMDHLKNDSDGAIIVPRSKYNLIGDVYGLFRVRHEWVLVVVQAKDWFLDTAKGNLMVDQWRQHRNVMPNSTMQFLNRHNNETETVHIVFNLFCANEIPKGIQCNDNEGIGNILHMKDWLPTAAYACQSAVQLRSIFTKPVEQ